MSRSSQRAAADRAFSKYIRLRDGMCRACGDRDPTQLQCAHVWSRSYHAVRYDERNAVALCRADHVRYTHHPLEWQVWVEANIPEWQRLRWLAVNHVTEDGTPSNKLDYLAIKRHYTELLEALV